MNRRLVGPAALVLIALALAVSACGVFAPRKPGIVILSPSPDTSFRDGEVVNIQSAATDSQGIVRIELAVDGNVVRADAPSGPQNSFSVTQSWTATAGDHTISVRAFNSAGAMSDPATIQLAVAGALAAAPTTPNAAPSATAVAGANCVDESAFVADVTIPDGSLLNARQTFDKIWRVRNTGTCAWAAGYQFTLLNGQVMATTPIQIPDTPPGATADLHVPMTAPATAGTFNSLWRLRNPNGTLFGETLSVTIRVAGASGGTGVSACSGVPTIEFFVISPQAITAGQAATLSWGRVGNADSAVIDNGIGGVATPGSTTVKPDATTTYTLTASCGQTTRTARATLAVNPAPTAIPPTAVPPTAIPPTAVPPTATSAPRPTATSPSSTTVVRCMIPGESGEAIKSGAGRSASALPQAGDDTSNNTHRALMSFDVRDLAGKTIEAATFNISAIATQGNPMSLGPLLVQQVSYSPPVIQGDYDIAGTTIATISSGPVGQYDIKSALQSAVSGNSSRFQTRLQLTTETNGNGAGDLLSFTHANDVCLSITYH